MPFQSLQKDSVYVEKHDGSRIGPYKTAVSGDSAIIFNATLDVTEGEKLIRPFPNGKEESYVITSINFSQGLASIPPHFTLELRKTTAILTTPPMARHTTVNINNSTGVQIGDHNMINIQNAINESSRRLTVRTHHLMKKPKRRVELRLYLLIPSWSPSWAELLGA